eukprot:11767724-Karenia_brevis.AAC.1
MGVARFKTDQAMWDYMKREPDLDFKGHQILRFTDRPLPDDAAEAARQKAVRKVVRTIIECNGGEGRKIKQEIEADYKMGLVEWKGSE